MDSLTLEEARRLFGDRLVEPADAAAVLGSSSSAPTTVPFSAAEAAVARENGCFLIYRPKHAADGGPVTLARLLERAGSGKPSGFQGDDPWFAERPFASSDAIEPGWALFHAEPWRETLNCTYERASAILRERSTAMAWRRRRAAEIAFDCLVVAKARDLRLLERFWDWSTTASEDGGFVNVGGFTAKGLEVLSYSPAVKHGALGICPTLVRPDAR